jgi:TPR repeat protein
MKSFAVLAALVLATCLNGGVGGAVKGAKYAGSQATIAENETAAMRGDAKAQYELGNAYCCSVGSVDLTHDTVKAYAPAQYRLGRLYSGNPVEGLEVRQRAKLLVADAPENKPLALMWLTLAARNGSSDAASKLAELERGITTQEQAAGQTYLADWQAAPCEWSQVFAGR